MEWQNYWRPRAITATRDDLGTRKALFRRVRRVPAAAAWALAVPVIGVSIGLAFAITPFAPVVLVLALAAGLVMWRYRDPQWLAVYERGIIYANGPYLQPVRWDNFSGIARDAREVALSYASSTLTLRSFTRQEDMAALLDAELQPRALARARASLAQAGQAEFPPLTITAERVRLAKAPSAEFVTWDQLDSCTRDGGELTLTITIPGRTGTWFRGTVSNAAAAKRLLDETGSPAPAPAAEAGDLLAAELSAGADQARQRARSQSRRARWRAAPLGALLLAVVIGPALGITPTATLQGVCGGHGYPGAAPYRPGGPAPVYFVSTGGFDDARLDLYAQDGGAHQRLRSGRR